MRRALVLLPIVTALVSGCMMEVGDAGETESQQAGVRVFNGKKPNGKKPNGTVTTLRQRHLRKGSFSGTTANGAGFSKLTLVNPNGVEASRLYATLDGGGNVNGTGFIGATMNGNVADHLGNVEGVSLRFDDVEQDVEDSTIWWYTVRVRRGNGAWYPICEDEAGNGLRAVAVGNRWDWRENHVNGLDRIGDANAITFLCEGYAMAKCVDWGLKPWKNVNEWDAEGHVHSVPMWFSHQSCVRALLLDVCGRNDPQTTDGTEIDIWNFNAVLADDVGWEPRFEAGWGIDGAVCVGYDRWSRNGNSFANYVAATCPNNNGGWTHNDGTWCVEHSAASSFDPGYFWDNVANYDQRQWVETESRELGFGGETVPHDPWEL